MWHKRDNLLRRCRVFLHLKGLDNLWRLGWLVFPLLAIASQFCVICATESLKTSFQTLYPKFHQPAVAPASFGHLSAAAVVRVRYNICLLVYQVMVKTIYNGTIFTYQRAILDIITTFSPFYSYQQWLEIKILLPLYYGSEDNSHTYAKTGVG